ncbi:ubiquitin-like-conjugating enzyme ATG10 [Aethina tumida]|uniref:ubiquitin-like-conjugating enzyme ATG10 n=1 Tax=Aethina tumida TaxID=116153 RepID=UPI00096B63A6|nr:ubiquitin-like-conjugating enzyme ATG10 [Aethina tumida]
MAESSMETLTLDQFNKCISDIVQISDLIWDGWILKSKEDTDNGKYLMKKSSITIPSTDSSSVTVTYEYHIAFSLSYSVPILCFNVWRSDGTLLSMEDYWNLNSNFKNENMYNSLTQLDHPVLCRPFLTLHPCKTQEIIGPFLNTSKNPVISWLSVVGGFVHLKLLEEYFKHC